MKKAVLIMIFSILTMIGAVILSAGPVYGNSAPSYWEAFPYSEVLAVDQDSPVLVDSERLTFDFSGADDYRDKGNEMSPVGKVTAEYQMTNPTDNTLSVQMAFPFAAALNNLSAGDISVSADGAAVPFEIFIDPDEIDPSGNPAKGFPFDYGTIGNITNQEWTLPGFDLDQDAKLYRFRLSGNKEDRLDFEINFHADNKETLLIGSDFEGAGSSEEGSGNLSVRIREKTEAEILILGQDPELTYEVLTADNTSADEERYQLEVIRESVDPKEYLLAAMRKEIGKDTAAVISDTQLLNLCLHEIWEQSQSIGFAPWFEALSMIYSDRLFTLVYQVEFPPGETRNVSVSYLTEGTMDRRETNRPTYSYTYLLSPAKNWADFGSLDVEVITPSEAPYIIESNPTLAKERASRYGARFEGLPETELTFTLYEKENVTILDKAEKKIYSASYLIFFLWPFIAIILLFIAILVIIKIIRRKRSH